MKTKDATHKTMSGGSTNFSASMPLPAGTNVVSVVTAPTSGAVATQLLMVQPSWRDAGL